LRKEDKILLLQRNNGEYSVVSGHVENGENFTDAIIREAKEEAGITIVREKLEIVHIQHKKTINPKYEKIYAYFLAREWEGQIQNMELDECKGLFRFDINNLPENVSDFVRSAIENIKNEIFYSEFGW
jgi:ADP-ribose pyrophosphatase YjhB (NUDIX family)